MNLNLETKGAYLKKSNSFSVVLCATGNKKLTQRSQSFHRVPLRDIETAF
jgi:hypothetical protein